MTENKRFIDNALKASEDLSITDTRTNERYEYGCVVDILNNLADENKELISIKNQYRGQRDYLLFVIERVCSKEYFEEIKGYLAKVVDEYD